MAQGMTFGCPVIQPPSQVIAMKAEATISAKMTNNDAAASENTEVSNPGSGAYRELTPHEFMEFKDMIVVVVKASFAVDQFKGYQQVVDLKENDSLDDLMGQWKPGQVVGLVCRYGDCSSKKAIRVSRRGFTVVHLAGGLQEWFRVYPGQAEPVAS